MLIGFGLFFNRRLVNLFTSPSLHTPNSNSNSRSGDTPHARVHNSELGTKHVLIEYLLHSIHRLLISSLSLSPSSTPTQNSNPNLPLTPHQRISLPTSCSSSTRVRRVRYQVWWSVSGGVGWVWRDKAGKGGRKKAKHR
jgi:hypothetical protein